MKSILLFSSALLIVFSSSAQLSRRALFLGNSYTYYNNLPQLTADVALSAGDTLTVSSNTPGGSSFDDHLANATSMSLIENGNWDFVVLQQQSQMPAFPISQVEVETFPYAAQLCDSIAAYNPCGQTLFYMTWGRENGDSQNCANWPPVCTYEGMDDLLRERYIQMAEMNDALVSPVGVVWREIRNSYPEIDLYDSDGSHPSPAGSYAAALCFYTTIFRKSPLNATFNYTIDDAQEEIMRNVVNTLVYQNLDEWFITAYDPAAALGLDTDGNGNFFLTNESSNADVFSISIGGGPVQEWPEGADTFPVDVNSNDEIVFIAQACGRSDTLYTNIGALNLNAISGTSGGFTIYPNPASDAIRLVLPEGKLYHYTILSATGQTGDSGIYRNGMELKIAHLSSGIYFLHLRSEGENTVQRFEVVK